MKKLLSILLVLVFCFGIFVSCNNETQTESSSDGSQDSEIAENAPAKSLSFFSESVTEEKYATYYKELALTCNDNVLSLDGEIERFFVINSYDELLEIASNPSLVSAEDFENNFILAWKTSNYWLHTELQGFHSLKIEGSGVTIKADFVRYSNYISGTSLGPYEITKFIQIPRSLLLGANANELEYTTLPITIKPSGIETLDATDFDYKNGTSWLIRSSEEWEQFSKIHRLNEASGFSSNAIALVVYREKGDQNKTIAYAEPAISSDGERLSISCYQIVAENEGQSTKCVFDIVYIEKDYALSVGIGESTIAHIIFKNIQ